MMSKTAESASALERALPRQRRQQALAAARVAFSGLGLKGAGLREIARRTGRIRMSGRAPDELFLRCLENLVLRRPAQRSIRRRR